MDSQKHISSAFDQDLTTLNDALQQLGEMAHRQFEAAINGLAMQSDSDLDDIISGDAALDALEAEDRCRQLKYELCLQFAQI